MGGIFSSGEKDNTGPQGLQGDTGQQGPKGDIGPQGLQGLRGDTGPQGLQGNIGPQGLQGPKGATGESGTFSLEQILSGGLDSDIQRRFFDAISRDTRFRGSTGPVGPKGETGNIENISNLATQLLNDDNFQTKITGGIVKNSDFYTLQTRFNDLKTDVETNYLKGGDATWWNNQLSSNYSLYNTNKNDPTKASTYIWNNFYNKTETDGKYAVKSTDTNGYANKGDLEVYMKTADADTKYASKNLIGKGIKLGNWNIEEDGNKLCFINNANNVKLKKCFGDETILTFDKN